ncbi:hypothetical protein AOC36_09900 [Erysipelothrix larvae]|uniref:V-type ATP synthase subunit D n=1 Tax=Erysipelothrix larvae TaxID=1514105 RepID=A0A0X8H1S5_9FIRM|nr:V-type ATP synthase subunit D [Erysipelothrix larvae]AMC94274.1 hypothetical protein AOC36_09900 [Erysipelothrix larvae]
MTRLRVNPTRMEMRNLERKLQIASRGHKLLKEKQDSLVQRFLHLSEETKNQRRRVDYEFEKMYGLYHVASLNSDASHIEKHLSKKTLDAHVDAHREHELGVRVLKYDLNIEDQEVSSRSVFTISHEVLQIEAMYAQMLPELVKLAELEKRCMVLASEIKETRRRVNALEHRTIPDTKETIAYIKMKIDDHERSQKARVMKVK